MKKILKPLIAVIIIISFNELYAATTTSSNKAMDHNVRVIWLGTGYGFHNGVAHPGILQVPPIILGFEWGIKVHPKAPLSFGGIFAYSRTSYKHKYLNNDTYWAWNYYTLAFRAAYHFTELIPVNALDVYAGIIIGCTIADDEHIDYHGDKYTPFATGGVYGGARYYFTSVFGLYLEAGYGVGFINGGIIFKF